MDTREKQLNYLEQYWELNDNIVCDGCEQPLEIDMACFEQMAESSKIDWEESGFVKHVVLRCENASGGHQDRCDGDCDYNDGDRDYESWDDSLICHNFNVWVDLWDYRFSGDEKKKPYISSGGATLKI